jgi:calcineurin-like phosphoesterase family protein
MSNIFLVSDTHFNHANILTFTSQNGTRVRDFKDVNHMNESMIDNWNSVVQPSDKVYHLGDVVMSKKLPENILSRLNGHKRLIRGNHDVAPTKDYLKFFDEVYSIRALDKYALTHIPIHPESLGRFKGNIHGHIHERPAYDSRYFNVSVERIDYTPIPFEVVKKRMGG